MGFINEKNSIGSPNPTTMDAYTPISDNFIAWGDSWGTAVNLIENGVDYISNIPVVGDALEWFVDNDLTHAVIWGLGEFAEIIGEVGEFIQPIEEVISPVYGFLGPFSGGLYRREVPEELSMGKAGGVSEEAANRLSDYLDNLDSASFPNASFISADFGVASVSIA